MQITRRVLSRAALSNGPMQAPQGMHGAGRKMVSRVALQGYGLGLIAWGLWYKLRDPLDFDKLRNFDYEAQENRIRERGIMHVGEEAAYSDGRFFAPASWQAGFAGWKERQDAEAEIVEAHKEEHGITKGKFGWQTPFAVKN